VHAGRIECSGITPTPVAAGACSATLVLNAMTELFPAWMGSLTVSEQRRVTWLLALAILLILTYLFRRSLQNWREARRITRSACRLGARLLRDVHLPDGMGGEVTIDFLALAADAILIIGVKRYDGYIFGSAHTDDWTQTIGNRSYKFPNPDVCLERQVSAVQLLIPGIPVRGVHLFADCAVFPRDKPINVLQVSDVRGMRSPVLKDIPEEVRMAWTELTGALVTRRASRELNNPV
jgi:hypothetical protein